MHLTDWDGKNLNGHGEKEETYFFAINKKGQEAKKLHWRKRILFLYSRNLFRQIRCDSLFSYVYSYAFCVYILKTDQVDFS
jgi:hypothetical protein